MEKSFTPFWSIDRIDFKYSWNTKVGIGKWKEEEESIWGDFIALERKKKKGENERERERDAGKEERGTVVITIEGAIHDRGARSWTVDAHAMHAGSRSRPNLGRTNR